MKISENSSLNSLNTFKLDVLAGLLIELENEEDVLAMPGFDARRDFILGGGSNVLFIEPVVGIVFLNRIRGIDIVEETDQHVLIEVGAGENWHDLVSWSVQHQYSGLENLALIPGLAGAAPIQNIGAYGVELASVLQSVTCWDLKTGSWTTFTNEQCQFSYRDSIFKNTCVDHYLITSICLKLKKQFSAQIHYAGLETELGYHEPGMLEAQHVYDAVIRLRQKKLPDPDRVGNAGSFFKNPVIDNTLLESILRSFPGMPSWRVDDNQSKVSAAWMIEQCGLKGLQHKGAAVSSQHALVLVNQGTATGSAIWELAQQIQQRVMDRFGLHLEPEPRIYFQSHSSN